MRAAARTAVLSLVLAMLALAAPGLLAQYSTSKYLDPNTFSADADPGFYLGMPMATDGAYTAISTTDAVWAIPVAGGTPQQLFTIGANLPSSATPATYIYGAVAVSDGMVVFHAAGGGGANPVIQGIYSVAADGSSRAVRVADSTQVVNWAQPSAFKHGEFGLFAAAGGTVVFTDAQGSIFSVGIDGSNRTTLWQITPSFAGCGSNDGGAVWSASNPATDGVNHAYVASNGLDRSHLYAAPPTTRYGCVALIARDCDLCAATDSLPGQPSPGAEARFGETLQIDDGSVYFYASAGSGTHDSHGYYGIFKVPLGGGAASAVVTNLSQLPLLQRGPGTFDEPYFNGFAVKNGRLVFYAGDNAPGGRGQSALYLVQGSNFVPVFTNQTSVDNQCIGNMEASNGAGLNQTALSPDGLLYITAAYGTSGPDLNGSCEDVSLRSNPFAYYVVDTTHPLIPAQTTISMAPAPADITASTPVTIIIAVGAAAGAGNPKALVPTGTVTVFFTSPQIDGVQKAAQATLDANGNASIPLGELWGAPRTFTAAYGGDSDFTQSGSNAITPDGAGPATLTSPTPGSVLPGPTATFTWSYVPGGIGYSLHLESASGVDLFDGASGDTATAYGLPTDGQPIYATLYTVYNNPLRRESTSATYTAATLPEPTLTTPTPGTVLAGPHVTFTWTPGTGANAYGLWVGTTGVGSKNVFDSGEMTGTSATATLLPTNGGTVYVRLYAYYNGVERHTDYTYTAATAGVLASPAPGTGLPGVITRFTWTAGTGDATGYSLWLGSTGVGSKNLFDSGETTATSVEVGSLPTNGETVYARLFTNFNGVEVHADYTYLTRVPTSIAWSEPAPISYGTALSSAQLDATASAGGKPVAGKLVYTPDAGTVLPAGTNTLSVTFTPTDINDYQSATATVRLRVIDDTAALLSPTPGGLLPGLSAKFAWSAASGASGYSLWLGSTGVGSKDLFNSGQITGLSVPVAGLPHNGETVYARLYADFGGVAVYSDYTYTAVTAGILTSPAPGSGLPGATTTFTWSAGSGDVTGYSFWLGSTGVGSKNLFDSGELGGTSVVVGGLPTNGETVYARLYTSYNGVVVSTDYTYHARRPTSITWSEPAPISYETALSATQLDATASSGGTTLPGAFVYTPAAGTVLPVRTNTLSVTFTPTDIDHYLPATGTVSLRVIQASATLTSPAPGSVLPGFSATFAWTSASGASGYSLWLGSTGAGSKNLFDSGEITGTTIPFAGLPHNGETVYARLYTNFNGLAVFNDYIYTAAITATLTSPTPGSVLGGPEVTFQWNSVPGASGYSLWLGSTGVGSKNLYDNGETTATFATAYSLPTQGETIYARLYTNFNGVAVHVDYTYTASRATLMLSPVPGSVLPGPNVTFSWASGATAYSLWLGTKGPGSHDLLDSGLIGTSYSAEYLPVGDTTIYARLSAKADGKWAYSDYTYTGAVGAALTNPAPGAVLPGPTATFSWPAVSWATGYTLHLASASGADLFDGGGPGNSATAYGLPTDGETIHATLETYYVARHGSGGASSSAAYTAATLPEPTLTTPTPGSVLPGPNVTFVWTAGIDVTNYSLWVGTTGPGSKDVSNTGIWTSTSLSTNRMPTNGKTVYVRLNVNYNGTVRFTDYTYTAAAAGVMTSPVPGTGLPGSTTTFTWTAGTGDATGYSLWLGSTGVGSKNLYDSGEQTATSAEVGGLPTNGETVYARLFTNFNGVEVHADYTYLTRVPTSIAWSEPAAISYGTELGATQLDATASAGGKPVAGMLVYTPDAGTVLPAGTNTLSVTFTPTEINSYQPATATVRLRVIEASAVLTAPAPGGALPGFSATFGWSSVTGAAGYSLWLGSTGVGSKNLFDSGETALTSVTVNGLPHNGEKIYARLYTNFNGVAVFADYTYSAAPTAVLTSPAPGSMLTGPNATFAWGSVSGASGYSLWLGTTGVGSKNLYDSGQTTSASLAIGGLPLNGKTIYARLYTIFNGIAVPADFTYTATAAATLTTPVQGNVLAGPEVTFAWANVPGAGGYSLWLGSTGAGSNNLFDSGEWPATSFKVGGLPMNGETIYARLYTRLDGVTAFVDSTYTAAQPGILTTPTPGSVLTGASVTFTWTPSTGTPSGYSLWVGTTGVGSNNLFDSKLEPVTSRIVNGLPAGGETVYVRLYTNFHGVVMWSDSTYTTAGTAATGQGKSQTP